MFKKLQSLANKMVSHFSHNDMDGYAPKVLSELSSLHISEFKPCSYDNFEKELDERISFYENHDNLRDFGLLITDIAPTSKEIVERLAALHKNGLAIVLLDHHDTARWIEEENPEWAFIQTSLDGFLTCGTELYHMYLVEKELLEDSSKIGEFVEHVRAYDTWDWSRNGNVFAKELNSLLYTLGPVQWLEFQLDKLLNGHHKDSFGFNPTEEILVDIESKSEAAYIRSRSNKVEEQVWKIGNDEYKVGVVFGERYHSTLGNELHEANLHLDFMAMIDMNGKKVSLRTKHEHVHVGEIAKAIGTGGGHQKAAGFQLLGPVAATVLMGTLHEIEADNKRFF